MDDLMRAKLLVAREMVALGEQVNVEFSQNRRETIDVVELGLDGAVPYAQPIAKRAPSIGKSRGKKAVGVNSYTLGRDFVVGRIDDRHFLRFRQHCPYANPGWSLMHA